MQNEFEIINEEKKLLLEELRKMQHNFGEIYVEHNFNRIIRNITKKTNAGISASSFYPKAFPNLAATFRNTELIFKNAFLKTESFQPLYHPSETIYKDWLANFSMCDLAKVDGNKIQVNYEACKNSFETLKSWSKEYVQAKGSTISNHIKWDLGDLPLNNQILYKPKNSFVKDDLLKQLSKSEVIVIESINDEGNIIEISQNDHGFCLQRKPKFTVKPMEIQNWLKQFGIKISLTTATYLIEFGMPYCGKWIDLNEILRYQGNGSGILGRLGSHLSVLIVSYESGNREIELERHPLWQSVVIAFARLEYYLNPINK